MTLYSDIGIQLHFILGSRYKILGHEKRFVGNITIVYHVVRWNCPLISSWIYHHLYQCCHQNSPIQNSTLTCTLFTLGATHALKSFKTKLEEILIKSKLVIESDECFSIIIIEVHPSNFVVFVIIILVKICENSTLNNINYWAINFNAHFRLQYILLKSRWYVYTYLNFFLKVIFSNIIYFLGMVFTIF